MEECLQVLSQRPECPNDQVLVQLVQLQLIVEKVKMLNWEGSGVETAGPTKMFPFFYMQALESQLQEVKHHNLFESPHNGKPRTIANNIPPDI